MYVYYIDSMVHAAVGCVYISQVHWVNRTFICNTKGPSLAQAMGWLGFFELSNSIVLLNKGYEVKFVYIQSQCGE